jgi:hypothetical protein
MRTTRTGSRKGYALESVVLSRIILLRLLVPYYKPGIGLVGAKRWKGGGHLERNDTSQKDSAN